MYPIHTIIQSCGCYGQEVRLDTNAGKRVYLSNRQTESSNVGKIVVKTSKGQGLGVSIGMILGATMSVSGLGMVMT